MHYSCNNLEITSWANTNLSVKWEKDSVINTMTIPRSWIPAQRWAEQALNLKFCPMLFLQSSVCVQIKVYLLHIWGGILWSSERTWRYNNNNNSIKTSSPVLSCWACSWHSVGTHSLKNCIMMLWSRTQPYWIQILTVLFTISVTLAKLLNLLTPSFLTCKIQVIIVPTSKTFCSI